MSAAGGTVALRDLAPPIRAALLEGARGGTRTGGHPRLRIDSRLVPGRDPAYLLLADRAARAVSEGTPDLAAQLERAVTDEPWDAYPADAATVVSLLACWDQVLRDLSIYDGNVYLASEGAVAALIEHAGADFEGDSLETTLDDLEALQVIYRFPVAMKFRGTYTRASQCRANCWGREMAAYLAADPNGPMAEWTRLLTEVGRSEHDRYREHFQLLRQADGDPRERWASSQSLPISVLV